MDSFLITMLLVFAIALGGREQRIVAQFSDAVGRSTPLMLTAIGCAVASACVMGWAGWSLAAMLPDRAADMLVAIALAIAAFELGWAVKLKPMKEPTRSFVAIAAVLFVRQLGDAARFVVFAYAAQAVYPVTTMIGGALGGAAAVGLGWMAGLERLERVPLRAIRMAMAFALIVAALLIGMNARLG